MASAKNTQTAVTNNTRLSTCGAKLEACSGYNGSCDCTISPLLGGLTSLAPHVDRACGKSRSSAEALQRFPREDAHDSQDRRAVSRRRGVILEAEQQHLVYRRSNF